MAPDSNDEHGGRSDGERAPEADGGTDPGFDEAALYTVVRTAVEDAILGAVGTLLLVGIAFVVVWIGITLAASSLSLAGTALGVTAVAVGVYIAAATLEVVPPIRDWF